jgi:hypothetical protein
LVWRTLPGLWNRDARTRYDLGGIHSCTVEEHDMARLDRTASEAVKHAGKAAEQAYEAVRHAKAAARVAGTKAKKVATQVRDKVTGRAAKKRKAKIAAAVVGTAAAVAVGVGVAKARGAKKSRKR